MSGWMLFQWIILALALFPAGNFLRLWKGSRVVTAYCVIVLFGYIWALGQQLENCAYLYQWSEALFTAGLLICYAGMCALGPACVYFAWRFSGKHHLCRDKRAVGGLFGLGGFFYLIVLSNGWHHLYYTSFSMAGRTYGPAFYVFTVFSYLCFAYAYIVVQRAKWDRGGSSWIFTLCFGPPVLANTLVMILRDPAKDVTPLCYCILLAASYWIVYRYWPVNLTPVAARHVFDAMNYPVIVTDGAEEILYQNPETAALPALPESQTRFAHGGRVFKPSVRSLPDGNVITGFTDITEYDAALKEQERQNAALNDARRVLDEQAEALRRYESSAAELATERRRVEIMSRLSTEVETQLIKLRESIGQSLEHPEQENIERNAKLAVGAFGTVRDIIAQAKYQ